MAANNEASFAERNQGWYRPDITEINEDIRNLLKDYSGLPSSGAVPHVNLIRKQAFASNPYPCIGLYRFLNLTLLTHPLYNELVERLKRPDATYLDLGCCFGQDLRQLVLDGVPSDRLVGLDIAGALMEHGYHLFLDRQTLESRFIVADIFKGAAQGATWTDLEKRGFDIIHCSAFFHLFELEDQITAARNIVKLVKKGGVIVGRQIGSLKPGNVAAIKEGSYSYRHDVQTFRETREKVGEATETRWEVQGSMDLVDIDPTSPVEDANSRRLLFTVSRLE